MRLALAIAVLAAPLAWAVQLVAGYALTETACTRPGTAGLVGGRDVADVIATVSVCALVVAGLGWLLAVAFAERGPRAADGHSPTRFLGAASALAAPLLALLVVAGLIAVIALPPCSRA